MGANKSVKCIKPGMSRTELVFSMNFYKNKSEEMVRDLGFFYTSQSGTRSTPVFVFSSMGFYPLSSGLAPLFCKRMTILHPAVVTYGLHHPVPNTDCLMPACCYFGR